MTLVLHITQLSAWQAGLAAGSYRDLSLETEGYIHCSTETQMQRTANKYYVGVTGLVLLEIDPAKLTHPLRFEPAGSWLLEHPNEPHSAYTGELYPHLYGPLNPEAVTRVIPYAPDSDGHFGALPL
jgi:uncharacterized protein (DUF952 family)